MTLKTKRRKQNKRTGLKTQAVTHVSHRRRFSKRTLPHSSLTDQSARKVVTKHQSERRRGDFTLSLKITVGVMGH